MNVDLSIIYRNREYRKKEYKNIIVKENNKNNNFFYNIYNSIKYYLNPPKNKIDLRQNK